MHVVCSEDDYFDDNRYRAMVMETSRLKTFAVLCARYWPERNNRTRDVLQADKRNLVAIFGLYVSHLKNVLSTKAASSASITSEALQLCQLLGLIKHDPNGSNDHETRLETLFYEGDDLESTKLFIDAGAEMNADVLVSSCKGNTPDCLKLLIECRADIERHRYMPLSNWHSDQAAITLLEARADVNAQHEQ